MRRIKERSLSLCIRIPRKTKRNLKWKRKVLGNYPLDMVNGGAGEYIEPTPASLPDPESRVPMSSARTDPEIKPLNYIWDK